MTLKSKKIILLFTLIFLAITSFSVVGVSFAKDNNSTDSFTFESSIKETYSVGEIVEIPVAKFGDEVADFVVYLPDGTATYSNSFELSQNGKYTVEYSFITDDRIISESLSFNVLSPMFSIVGDGYTEFRTLENGTEGVYANLSKNSSLVYNGVIDLTKISGMDLLFKFITSPAVAGEADTNNLEFTLTDAYDDNLFINLRFKKYSDPDSSEYSVSYIDCGFNGGAYCGLQRNTKGKFVYDNQNYTCTKNNEKYGADFTFSMTGGMPGIPKYNFAGITYDETTGLIYAKTALGYKVLVTDLENINIYGEKFPGFTDGKVKFSVRPYNMMKTTCGLFFSEIAGQTITKNNYNAFESSFYPEIKVDLGENENLAPNAKQGKEYKVFNATALDVIDGNLEVKTEVYFGYENQNKIRVNVSNNSFIPNRIGEYTIVYTATNSFGKTSQSFVKIKCSNDYEKLNLAFENEWDYSIPAKVGNNVKLFDGYEIVNNFGASNLSVTITLKEDNSIVYNLDDDFCFEPLYAGEYEIVYSFADYIEEDSFIKTLTVTKNDAVRYELTKNLNKYFISNGEYDINVVKAYSLSSGKPVEVPIKAYYIADSSLEEKLIEENFIAVANEKVTLLYRAQTEFEVEPFTIDVPVINTIFDSYLIDKTKYFIPTKGSLNFETTDNSIICEFLHSENGIVSLDFANVLARNEFSMTLESYLVNGDFNPFGRLNLYLEDSKNANNVVKLSLYRENGIWLASVNDGNPLKFKDSWGMEGDLLEFNYDIYGQTFSLNNEINFSVPYFYNSTTPVLFEEGLNLTIEFENVGSCKGIKIREVNGQVFNNSNYDTSNPTIDRAHDKNTGTKSINTVIDVGGFYAFDVLSPNTQVYLTVRGPQGVVTSVDGIFMNKVDAKLFYKIKLTEYGNYTVKLDCTDGENDDSKTYNITVENIIPPTVTITSKTDNGKVGKSIQLAKFTVEMANNGEYKYFFAIFEPNAHIAYTKDKTFVPKYAGKYEVHLFVFDTNYNLTELIYDVVVE